MECGSGDLVCEVMSLFADNELPAGAVVTIAAYLSEGASGALGKLAGFFREFGQTLIGLAGFIFGVMRWWRYREAILHKRLEKYLADNDARLSGGESYILKALRHPSPGQKFSDPLFAGSELRSVLREREWGRDGIAASVERSADLQLEKAGERARKRIELSRRSARSLNDELATTYILRGAIAASEARRTPQQAIEKNNLALLWFKTARLIPEHENNLAALEYQAHVQRRLGDFEGARDLYSELVTHAVNSPKSRSNELLVARAKRFEAETQQAISSTLNLDGTRTFYGSMLAFNLLSPKPAAGPTAINLRAPLAPFEKWDLLEQADLHYFTAFVAHNLNFGGVRQSQLGAAKTAYQGVIAGLPTRWFWTPREEKELRKRAEAGLDRVQQAINGNVYDTDWLIPSK